MGLFSKPQQPETASPEPDRLREIAAEKVAAAERLSAAIAQAGEAVTALFEADRAYLAEYRVRHGWEAYSASRLLHQLRGMLLSDLELHAPDLLKHLDQPRQPRARCETIASQIARQVENDLASVPQSKEPAL